MKKTIPLLVALALCLYLCACNGESPETSYTGDSDYVEQTQPVQAEEISAVTEGSSAEEVITPSEGSGGYPPKGEYTEIILQDERYYLCKLERSGFSESGTYYGIYDGENRCWALEYAKFDVYGQYDNMEFNSHGNGVFSYKYYSYNEKMIFLSAELGDSFETPEIINYKNIKFVDGKAVFLIEDDSLKGPKGTTPPHNKLVYMDTYGHISDVKIKGFSDSDAFYWSEGVVSGSDMIFAGHFKVKTSGEWQQYVFIYFYDDGSYTLISDQDYTAKVSWDCKITYNNGSIFLCDLEGADGNTYFAEFDKEGNFIKLYG